MAGLTLSAQMRRYNSSPKHSACNMLFDLHSHSTYSDGALSPAALLERAQQASVDVLALTDHDTVAGVMALMNTSASTSTNISTKPGRSAPRVLPGVEFSSRWGTMGVHIVGLNIQLDSSELHDAVAKQQQTRHQRATIIAERLSKKGFPNLLPAVVEAAGQGSLGRPHFAQALVDIGGVRSREEAFRKYLGTGKTGDVKNLWPSLNEVVNWVRIAGGTAVLAHPDKYHLTHTKLRALITDFKTAGGKAIEVVSGHQIAYKTKNLADLCQQYDLFASCGSDFHKPGQHWAEVGKHSALPDGCRPVWELW